MGYDYCTMQTFEARLWSKISVLGKDECWPWLAGKHKGYGRLRKKINGKWTHISAAKAAWEDRNGPMPEGYEPEHTCCNVSCCNPDHIEATTHSENMKRVWRRGRAKTRRLTGTNNPRARFDMETAATIKSDTRSSRALAKLYGVNKVTILRIRAGKTYATDESTLLHHPAC